MLAWKEDRKLEACATLPPGEYIALLTHSGYAEPRAVCQHYSRIAMDRHRELPKELKLSPGCRSTKKPARNMGAMT